MENDSPLGLVDEIDLAEALGMPVAVAREYVDAIGLAPLGQYRGQRLWRASVAVSLLDGADLTEMTW